MDMEISLNDFGQDGDTFRDFIEMDKRGCALSN